jgi:uncharacterized protein YbjT (DUF2867 family)
MDTQTILVAGATGHVGHHVVAGLVQAGVTVKAMTRDPDRAVVPTDVIATAGDLSDPGSLREAAAGADAAFLLWPFMSADGADAAVQALASQVRHIVYLSAISVRDEATAEENGVWGQVEQAVTRHAAGWTFLRAGGFATNTLGWAEEIRSRGVVRWEEAPAEETAELLAAVTGNRAFADHAVAYWASLVTDPEPVTDDVERVTGHPARPFGEWARDHAADFTPRTGGVSLA